MTERFAATGDGSACYHVDEECDRLQFSRVRPASDAYIEWHGLDPCPDCAGEREYRGPRDPRPATERGGETA